MDFEKANPNHSKGKIESQLSILEKILQSRFLSLLFEIVQDVLTLYFRNEDEERLKNINLNLLKNKREILKCSCLLLSY